jgi:multidrug resistance efflux pump
MAEELENEQPENGDDTPTNNELADIKAQLEGERATLAAAQASLTEAQATLTEKDGTIATLEANIATLQQGFDDNVAALGQLQEANTTAIGKYLAAVRGANTALPADVITGDTIEAIDASVGQAQAIADAVRTSLADEAKKGKVPAGAPTRVVNLDGLTAKEKIALGLSQQKGGNA